LSEQSPSRLLERIAALVSCHAGFNLPREKLWMLERRVAERRRELSSPSLADYAARLEARDGELERLVEALRVGETRFFRLGDQERALRRVTLPEIGGRRPLRIWSAGCASGEEPFTVAMIVEDWLQGEHRAAPSAPAPPFSVLGTDISADALRRAREAVYDAGAVRGLDPELLERFFERRGEGYTVRPSLRDTVEFVRHNLVAEPYPGEFDLVLCRNVLIYFDRPTREAVARRLMASLTPGGFLFLGTSETIQPEPFAGVTSLRTPDGLIYQRTDTDNDREEPGEKRATEQERRPDASRAPAEGRRVVQLRGSYDGAEAHRLAAELRAALEGTEGPILVDLDGASFLADDCARVLHRLASTVFVEGRGLTLVASRPGVKRWLHRHRELLAGIARCESVAEAEKTR
jgi:chemotaxis protein methyltransferase CheR